LSDVAVQMVAEDMFVVKGNTNNAATTTTTTTTDAKTKKNRDEIVSGRYVTTRHPVIVDGKETRQLDSVLCLVNTALLSHTGLYAGGGGNGGVHQPASTKKRNGAITSKTRKAIVKALNDTDNEDTSKLMSILCDFSLLLALDELLTLPESERLCRTVQKWARGLKKTTQVDGKLKQRLKQLLLD
jgi:hypothetical protein